MGRSEVRWVRLGDFIELVDERNADGKYTLDNLRGLSVEKKFIDSKANMDGVSLLPYKIVKPSQFCFVTITSRNSDKITLAQNTSDEDYIVSSSYATFQIKDTNRLLPDFLYLWFKRPEFDRYARFHSWGSAREAFTYEEMEGVLIPLPYRDGKPDVERQREVVETWQGLRRMKEQNEKMAEPLLQLCRSFMENLKKNCAPVAIGQFIEPVDERNADGKYTLDNLRGLSVEKKFIDSKANMDGVSLLPYKIVKPSQFCFVTITSRNSDKITLAQNTSDEDYIVSSSYVTFQIKDTNRLLPDFLYLWFKRPEFDRYARFHSWGSAREAFTYEEMEKVQIPLPDIETQRAIVNIYHCAEESRRIAREADRLSREICPALMQHIIHETV